MRVLIDSNILLRISDAASPVAGRIALAALAKLVAPGCECCLVPQVLYEFWVVATRPSQSGNPEAGVNGLGMDPASVHAMIDAWKAELTLKRDERGVYEHWQQLVITHSVQGKKSHDARLVAAMLRHGISHLLTFNVKDFARFPMISILSPDDVLSDAIAKPTTSEES